MNQDLLEVRGLNVRFRTSEGVALAVDDVSLAIEQGEIRGVVGESGCGKTVTALSILRLIPTPPGHVEAAAISFEGKNLLAMSNEEMRSVRGNRIAMIFQEPMSSLNPVFSVGYQIAEVIQLHQKVSRKSAMDRAVEALREVAIPLPERRVYEYPHQLSGGMRQRVMIAMALSCGPSLLIADEPTSSLDVTIQAQILQIMKELQNRTGMAIMFITHDLSVIAELAHRITVMYAGQVVEEGPVLPLFRHPFHPYLEGLLEAVPRLEADTRRLQTIDGVVPTPWAMPVGCRFAPRCRYVQEHCLVEAPLLAELSPGRTARCWYPLVS